MGTLSRKVIHDCPKPNIGDSGQYRWVCDCGAEWEWMDLSWITSEHREGPFWRRRTVTTEAESYWRCVSRPVTWEDVPAVAAAVLATLTDTGDNKEHTNA